MKFAEARHVQHIPVADDEAAILLPSELLHLLRAGKFPKTHINIYVPLWLLHHFFKCILSGNAPALATIPARVIFGGGVR
jgi:hypothetical protein